ncbi:MAG: DPP IV N-terminal domain-containing protein, partial [Runella sp.]
MRNILLLLSFWAVLANSHAQTLAPLTVEKIMRDPKWIGTAPTNPYWSEDGTKVYFNWNPDKALSDSLYVYEMATKQIRKVSPTERKSLPNQTGVYNRAKTQKLYEKNGDIFWLDIASGQSKQLTNTVEAESAPTFNGDESKVIFRRGLNLFSIKLSTGELTQLTNIQSGTKKAETTPNEQEKWLKADQLAMFEVLKERSDKKKEGDKIAKAQLPKRPKEIFLNDANLGSLTLSPKENFITYTTTKPSKDAKTTIVPNYVTESGFTEDIPARTKVGAPLGTSQLFIYDIEADTVKEVKIKGLTGLEDLPDFVKDYTFDSTKIKKLKDRKVQFFNVSWSEDGSYCVVIIRAQDNKDRWIALLDTKSATLKTLHRLRDEAWVGGPGAFWLTWADHETILFQSEETGYSHLYSLNVRTGEKKALISGKFEVQEAQLSKDKKTIYFISNEVHPGEKHFYRMAVTGGERIRLTTMTGNNEAELSPDESKIVLRYSYSTKPWELYWQENQPNTTATQITQSLTDEFKSYPWRDPQIIKVKATDGAEVYARL